MEASRWRVYNPRALITQVAVSAAQVPIAAHPAVAWVNVNDNQPAATAHTCVEGVEVDLTANDGGVNSTQLRWTFGVFKNS
jgi:hypothetical protein